MKIISAFILGVVLGVYFFMPKNVWDYSSDGLQDLDLEMANDHSKRLAVVALTEKGQYYIVDKDIEKRPYMVFLNE